MLLGFYSPSHPLFIPIYTFPSFFYFFSLFFSSFSSFFSFFLFFHNSFSFYSFSLECLKVLVGINVSDFCFYYCFDHY